MKTSGVGFEGETHFGRVGFGGEVVHSSTSSGQDSLLRLHQPG